VEDHWPGPLSGLVITRYGHEVPCERIEIVGAAHPVPDQSGLDAARRMLEMVADLGEEDLVLCLISGGGSSLLSLPHPEISLEEKQALTRAMLASGAPIGEINLVRRHVSAIKGGRLAAACHPARILTLAISDVPGDDPLDIASGPTVADPTRCADALAILDRRAITAPRSIRRLLESGAGESVKPGDPRLARSEFRLIATPRLALEAAARQACAAGVAAAILGDAIEGEAREVAAAMAKRAIASADGQKAPRPPCVLLSGGEVTVTLSGSGRGGPNAEFLLALAIALDGDRGVHALAGDTDGVDGAEEIAGAYIGPDTLARARRLGIDPNASLADNDAHRFFGALGDQLVTGPTLTNVNDFRAILLPAVRNG
jgi:hydroxypyruvate reductase